MTKNERATAMLEELQADGIELAYRSTIAFHEGLDRPCAELGWCPYGGLTDRTEIRLPRPKSSRADDVCSLTGRTCPVYSLAEPVVDPRPFSDQTGNSGDGHSVPSRRCGFGIADDPDRCGGCKCWHAAYVSETTGEVGGQCSMEREAWLLVGAKYALARQREARGL